MFLKWVYKRLSLIIYVFSTSYDSGILSSLSNRIL